MNFKAGFLIFLIIFISLPAIDSGTVEEDETISLTEYYTLYPLNINRATFSDIYNLPYIDDITAEAILLRIREKGELASLEELVEENIITPLTADALADCVVFSYGKAGVEKGEYSVRFKRRLERSRGYDEKKYLGNPSQFTHRLRFSSRNLAFNALAEKEPGEANYSDNLKGNIIYSNDRYRILFGNFNVISYTGMLQDERFSFDQYAFSTGVNYHDFARPSISTVDYFGYNGASVLYQSDGYRLSVFGGRKYISASLNDLGEIRSVNLYAYTRTVNEIERYHNSLHDIYGAGFEFRHNIFRFAASVSSENFDRDVDPASRFSHGMLGELSFTLHRAGWILRADTASDMSDFNLKLHVLNRQRFLRTEFFYGLIRADRMSLTSRKMMYGGGDNEQALGMKFMLRPFSNISLLSENILYTSYYNSKGFPGAQFSIKAVLKSKNTVVEPSFRYKHREITDRNFAFTENREYLSRIRIIRRIRDISLSADMRYTDKSDGGYGYLLGTAFNYRSGFYRFRAGGDIYYSKKGAMLYASYADTGRYPGLYSFSGTGRKTYIMAGSGSKRYEVMAGISRHKKEDGDTFGSGNDMIYSDTVHTAELNLRVFF